MPRLPTTLRRLLLTCLLGSTPLLPAAGPIQAAGGAPPVQLVTEPDQGPAP